MKPILYRSNGCTGRRKSANKIASISIRHAVRLKESFKRLVPISIQMHYTPLSPRTRQFVLSLHSPQVGNFFLKAATYRMSISTALLTYLFGYSSEHTRRDGLISQDATGSLSSPCMELGRHGKSGVLCCMRSSQCGYLIPLVSSPAFTSTRSRKSFPYCVSYWTTSPSLLTTRS